MMDFKETHIGDMSVYCNGKVTEPHYGVDFDFATEIEAKEFVKHLIKIQKIHSDIEEIILRKGQSDEDRAVIKCLKDILQENDST